MRIEQAIKQVAAADLEGMATPVDDKTLDDLKFSVCLPRQIATDMLRRRMTDRAAIRSVLSEPVRHNVAVG